jgi:8-oxo-dGTP pyrophosphatase MutT (NUDIX family)
MDSNKSNETTTYQLYQEISAGGVPIIIEKGVPKFVAIDRVVVKDTSLPKGHQKAGESLQETAIREVLEETGFKSRPVKYLGKFTYKVKDKVHKKITMVTVHWFIMIVESGKPTKANNETKKVRIIPLDSDLSILTYDNHRMFVERTRKIISKYLPK